MLGATAAWAVPPGTQIDNRASAVYRLGATAVTAASNLVQLTTSARTPSAIEFLQYAPAAPAAQPEAVSVTEYSAGGAAGGPFVQLPPPLPFGNPSPIDLGAPVPLVPASSYHGGEPVFVRLTDGDQNTDPAVRETVLVTISVNSTGDTELLRLTETGPDTGIFTGYLQTGTQSPASGNGILSVAENTTISARYTDAYDGTDSRTTAALVDPFGTVFNSLTGQAVSGVSITIINDATGLPANVFGDDGVSPFPATLATGGTAVDSSGRTYTFPPGGYRFPFLMPGTYRLDVAPPPGFLAPSTAADADLQVLPGAPFAIVAGSREDAFTLSPGPALRIDIPIDPVSSSIYLLKTAGKSSAALGDVVQYKLTVQNNDPVAPLLNVVADDRLPAGFRYETGSTRVRGAVAADPPVSDDGRTLRFSVGTLAGAETAEITYVVSVGAGARPGPARNIAVAAADLGAVSNTATAVVQVTEDLIRSRSFILGRVMVDGCGDPEKTEQEGLEGVRIYLEDGTSVITDKNGMYHLEGLTPGSHVVQMDLATIPEKYEVVACEENTRFAGNASSQFVDLQGGVAWRADFHLALKPRITGETGIELRSVIAKKGPQQKDTVVEYAVPVHVGPVPIRNARLIVILPDPVSYKAGTTRLNALPRADPAVMDGVLTFTLGSLPEDWEGTLRFSTDAVAYGMPELMTTRAYLVFATPQSAQERTPLVENVMERQSLTEQKDVPDIILRPRFATLSADLTAKDRKNLNRMIADLRKAHVDHITVTGHTDSHKIRYRAKLKFKDNYELSRARAATVGEYLAQELELGPGQVTLIGKGPDEPVDTNKTAAGRARNRRVEVKVATKRIITWSDILPMNDRSGMKAVATIGLRPGEKWEEPGGAAGGERRTASMPVYDAAWLNSAEPGFEWLWPPEGYNPTIPALKIAVKHDPSGRIQLTLNGQEVGDLYRDSTLKRGDGAVGVILWRGVHLAEGDNEFEAVAYDAAGNEAGRMTRRIHYAGMPVKAEAVPELSRLIADGKTVPVVAVRLTDKYGQPAREGVTGDFTVDPPHLPLSKAQQLQQEPLAAPANDRTRYVVGPDGVALIELQPTTATGRAMVRLPLAKGTQDVPVWLKPEARDWILVGLAEGTAGYNAVKGNMESLAAAGGDDDLYENGRVAFFAKGAVRGEWLLTIAYDSAKRWRKDEQSLYQLIDPNRYYTLYGDATVQNPEAPSARALYLKIERDGFYALFGDYTTGLTVTELSRYNRSFNGLKSEMKSGTLEVTVFASDTNQAFVKDEIPGDGTSGLYRLTRKNIVINSETVVIETRSRFRSELILSSRRLSRFLDYTIDYETGSLFFKSPVFSRDENLNPVFIVVDYESFDQSDLDWNYGGRAAVKVLSNVVEAGANGIHEGGAGREGDLEGIDLTARLGPGTRVRVEAASSEQQTGTTSASGSAYLAEVLHQSEQIDGRVYLREQEPGFGLGQQNLSESGTRKQGLDLQYRYLPSVTVRGEAYQQEYLATGADRDFADIEAKYGQQTYDVIAGLRHVSDTLSTGEERTSDQVIAGLVSRPTDRISLRLQHEQALSSSDGVGDFPTRTTLGADYRFSESTSVFAAHEMSWAPEGDASVTRAGLRTAPWTGAAAGSTIEQQATENGVRLFSTTGLKQGWRLSDRWSVDAGFDRSATIRQTGGAQAGQSVPVPNAAVSSDFTAVSLGAGFREKTWSWTGRIEERRGDAEDKTAVFTGAWGELRPGLALAAALSLYSSEFTAAPDASNLELRVGVVYRPRETNWLVLDKLELKSEEFSGGEFNVNGRRIVNNLNVNYKASARTQVGLQYAAKFVSEAIDDREYRGYTDLTGVELRYDLTKKWDIGFRESMLHTWQTGQTLYCTGVSTGMNVADNIWVSVGYNFDGFRDRDFSRAEFTSQGAYVKFRMKFDQVSAGRAVKWISGL